MVLRNTLANMDIPHRDRVREAIINRWKRLFKELKVELSVGLRVLPSTPPLT